MSLLVHSADKAIAGMSLSGVMEYLQSERKSGKIWKHWPAHLLVPGDPWLYNPEPLAPS